jgi:hypothetical protein
MPDAIMESWRMSLKLMLSLPLIAVINIAISPAEAIANECDEHGGDGCRGLAVATHRATTTHGVAYAYRPPFIPSSREGPVTGCYGFDHGPFYSPHSCIIPYPCAYYGTCK